MKRDKVKEDKRKAEASKPGTGRVQQSLQKSVIHHSKDGIVLTDEKGKIVEWNPAMERITGLKKGEVLEQELYDVQFLLAPEGQRTPEYRKQLKEGMRRIVKDNDTSWSGQLQEVEIQRTDGERCIIQTIPFHLKTDSGVMTGSIHCDVTESKKTEEELLWYREQLEELVEDRTEELKKELSERRRAEEALRKSEEKYRNVFESASDGIFTMDLNGTYTEANKGILEIYGLNSTDEIIGKSGFEFVAPQDIEKAREGMKKVLEEGSVLSQEFTALRIDGSEVTVEITGTLLKDESGDPIGITGIARDITERRRLEEGFRKTERLESLGFLAGGIAHDFNNLLSGIFGQIELAIVNRTSEQKVLQSLERALQAMNRARDLTHQLLTFSSGGSPIKKLLSIGDDLRKSVTFALSGSNIHPVFLIDENLLPIEADQSQINQVINNILLNARQAMPEGGTVEIVAKNFDNKTVKGLPLKQGRHIQIAIQDHGIGIPGDILEKIFDPFYTTKQTGSGLGLSICYSIVKKHDGHITVNSTPGAGSVFTIYLPASEKEIHREPEKKSEVLKGKGKILVMDDEPIVCELLAGELDLLGYEVVVTQDGEETVQAYKKELESGNKFDAVILDLTIPGGKGGKEVIKELQKIAPDIKAVVSSGYSENPVIADPVKFGFRNAIQKPFKMDVLSHVLYDLVNK